MSCNNPFEFSDPTNFLNTTLITGLPSFNRSEINNHNNNGLTEKQVHVLILKYINNKQKLNSLGYDIRKK